MGMGMHVAGIQVHSAVPSTTDPQAPIWHASPNYGPRRDGLKPSLIVLHYTAMNSAQEALDRLCDPVHEVSAHYLIGGDGTLWHMVREEDRAWHAGAGEWSGQKDINSRSIGIELDNTGRHPFSDLQMRRLEQLLPQIMHRWSIRPYGVIGHSDMAPGRKFDPGPRFDWLRLERNKLAAPRGQNDGPLDAPMDQFRILAQSAGFSADVDDETLLSAVRLRYRPWATGPLQSADLVPMTARS
ncbi:N-acetylmuramoyl-L-alanine amidase AmiD precursor [Ruegeria atlantica]|uniref:N-acetylmuramoyl-L-alanine amidase n=2 Tax=Ruegeria atlantica TaxID=81569 RepID=A0A0P1EAX0_9RHOB|nr:N-acetylmuramoyl-L-alanine amidase AmiD precursor [Ruegeria atlantica]